MFNKTNVKTQFDQARTGSQPSSPASIMRNHDATPIEPSIHINGHIRANEDLIVYGHVEGSIHLGDGLLLVTREGQVDADVNARVITIEGRVEGNLRATEQIVVRRSGRVRGSICAPRIALDFGCSVHGAIDTSAAKDAPRATDNDNIADFEAAMGKSSTR